MRVGILLFFKFKQVLNATNYIFVLKRVSILSARDQIIENVYHTKYKLKMFYNI